MHEVKIKEDVFGVKLTVVQGARSELDDYVIHNFPGAEGLRRGESGTTQKLVGRDSGHTEYLVLMVPFSELHDLAATLSHECLHVAIFALKSAGVKWHDPELLCYYSEFFFRNALEELSKEIRGK